MWLWARARQDDRLTHPALGLRAVRRIPSLATCWYAVRTTPAGELERALAPLLSAERDLARDGTWLRGSTRDATDALRVVTRAGVTAGQVWAQRAVPDGDEWAAALALLEAFPLEGKVISADAGLLRPPFVQNAVEQKGVTLGSSSPISPTSIRPSCTGSGCRTRGRQIACRRSHATDGARAGRCGWRRAATSARSWNKRAPGPARSGAAGSNGRAGAPDGKQRAATSGLPALPFPGP